MKLRLAGLMTGILLLAFCGSIHAQSLQYEAIDLGSLGVSSFATAINNVGQVAGYYYTSTGVQQSFMYSNGAMTGISPILGFTSGYASGINDAGVVVGNSFLVGPSYAFLYDSGSTSPETVGLWGLNRATDINNVGQIVGGGVKITSYNNGAISSIDIVTPMYSAFSSVNAINDLGQFAGDTVIINSSYDAEVHAAMYSDGIMIDLGVLPMRNQYRATWSGATAINNLGQVVGYSYTDDGYRAFLYDESFMTNLGSVPGGGISLANGINDRGQIVGYAAIGTNPVGFIYTDGEMYDLNTLITDSSFNIYDATAINELGRIAAYGSVNGLTRAILLKPVSQPSPVPLPSTILLLGSGMVGMVGMCRSRYRRKN